MSDASTSYRGICGAHLSGFGHIAQRTAEVAKTAFKMKVAAVRRDPTKEDGGLCDIPLGDKKELFAQSDFVVCVLPGTPQTLDYCGAEEFAAMKPTGVFISMGRGVCVDEDALAAALQAGQIKGAALDVFKVEPLPESSPLWDCGAPTCVAPIRATAPCAWAR